MIWGESMGIVKFRVAFEDCASVCVGRKRSRNANKRTYCTGLDEVARR